MTDHLLDVNVLLALCDPMHVHHEATHRWFAAVGRFAWATCPITENGFVRVGSHPSYPNRPGDAAAVLEILRQFCAADEHRFWAADLSIRDLLKSGTAITHTQVTDLYLLGLAVRNGGKLATLDRRISADAVDSGGGALVLLPT
ncbi:MAG TPA: TA system VapC family ribonuclease toxin [Thermomicrobiales bacterium]